MRTTPGGRLLGGVLGASLVLGGGLLAILGAVAFADAAVTGATPVSLGVLATSAGAACLGAALLVTRGLRR